MACFPKCAKIQNPNKMQIRETSVHTNIQLNLMTKRKIQKLLHFTLRREMNDRCNFGKSDGWQDPMPSETSSSRKQVRSEKGNIGTYTGSHPDSIRKSAKPNVPTIGDTSIEWSFVHGRKKQGHQHGILDKKYEQNSPVVFWEAKNKFFKPIPESNVSPPSMNTSKEGEREKSLWIPTLHLTSKSGFVPEEQETMQQSKDPSVGYECKWKSYDWNEQQ